MAHKCAGGCGRVVFTEGETCGTCRLAAQVSLRQTGGPVRGATVPCAGGCGARVSAAGTHCPNCQARRARAGLSAAPVVAPVLAPTLAAGTLPAGANLTMSYRRDGDLAATDAPNGSTLHVLVGTRLTFRADSVGGATPLRALVDYGTAQWLWPAPALSGTGVGKIFNFASATPGGGRTLTLSFGGQAVSVTVVVFSLSITSVPANNFAGRSQTDLGVDERVALGFTTIPPGVTAVQAGGLTWRFAGAAAQDRATTGVLRNPVALAAGPAADGTAQFLAPYRTHGPNDMVPASTDVALELVIQAGPSHGMLLAHGYRIHKPAAHMRQDPTNMAIHHWNPPGGTEEPSAGFYGVIFFTPKTVSFRTIVSAVIAPRAISLKG